MITSKWYQYTQAKKLSWTQSSVHYANTTRVDKAKEQLELPSKNVNKIIELTNEFLRNIGLKEVSSPQFTDFSIDIGDYGYKSVTVDESKFNKQFGLTKNPLNNSKHVVWMKFIKRNDEIPGHLGVVAASNDYNFDIPPDKNSYNNKTKNIYGKEVWQYSTSGIILHKLNLEWDESFILVFPLKDVTDGFCKDVEMGIGEYLIAKGIPIIDFYSHTF